MFTTARRVASATILILCSAALAACDPPTTPTPSTGATAKAFTRSVVVTGSVVNTAGLGLDLVEVVATSEGGGPTTTTTNAAGWFEVRLTVNGSSIVAASLSVTVARTGYSPITRSFAVPAEGPDTFSLPFTLIAVGGPLLVGGTVSGSVSSADRPCYVGEVYDSDYSNNCTYFSLTTPADRDVRVELRWSGTPALQLWAIDDLDVTAGTPSPEPGTISLVVPRGRSVQLIVGPRYPSVAPATPLGFTLSAAPTSASTNGR